MFHFIKQNKYFSYCIFSGLYGVARSFNGTYKPPNDVLGNRLTASLFNGILYSLYAPYYSMKLLNRIDIKLRKKEPDNYINSYTDEYSFNMNVFI